MAIQNLRITSVSPFADGKPWGERGSYELVRGGIEYGFDPLKDANLSISDLARAPRDEDGLVRAEGDLQLLRPADPSRGNGGLLYVVANRGIPLWPFGLWSDGIQMPDAEIDPQDGFVLRDGWTVVWSGWQFDVPRTPELLGLEAPDAEEGRLPVQGDIRIEFTPTSWQPDQPLVDELSALVGGTAPSYRPAQEQMQASLTCRSLPDSEATLVERRSWRFARDDRGRPVAADTHIWLQGGFQPGLTYELIYRSANCPVVGLGLLAVRDTVSLLRYHAQAGDVPLLSAPEKVIGVGASQSGRFLRQFLRDGMNTDEDGQSVFDALMCIVAGGRVGEFNNRGARCSECLAKGYVDLPPFSFDPPESGLLSYRGRSGEAPKIMSINSAHEYWRGDGSRVHIDATSGEDILSSPNVRHYLIAGTDHSAGGPPPRHVLAMSNFPAANRPTELGGGLVLRALFKALDEWVAFGIEPPQSHVPTRQGDTASDRKEVLEYFARLPTVVTPSLEALPDSRRLSLEPDSVQAGICEYPVPLGRPYPAYVSAIDADGNEVAGIRLPEVAVPVASYTGWNASCSDGRPSLLSLLVGSCIPFPITEADRIRTGDPRRSLSERYESRAEYVRLVDESVSDLVRQRFILEEDAEAAARVAVRRYDEAVRCSQS